MLYDIKVKAYIRKTIITIIYLTKTFIKYLK
jgi:hypothetical protein